MKWHQTINKNYSTLVQNLMYQCNRYVFTQIIYYGNVVKHDPIFIKKKKYTAGLNFEFTFSKNDYPQGECDIFAPLFFLEMERRDGLMSFKHIRRETESTLWKI